MELKDNWKIFSWSGGSLKFSQIYGRVHISICVNEWLYVKWMVKEKYYMELKVEILIFWEIIDTIVVNEYATRE